MAKDPAKSIKHEIFSSLEPVYTLAVWLIDVCWSIHVAVESDVASGSLRAVELRRVLQGDDGVYGSTEDTKRPCMSMLSFMSFEKFEIISHFIIFCYHIP
jgi:hypothetical protein